MKNLKRKIITLGLMLLFICSTSITYGKYVIDKSLIAANLQIDRTKPTGIINYSEIDKTKNDVIVTVKLSEPIKSIEGWELSNDGLTIIKTYETNIEENIKITDLAGNENMIQINVKNIDRTVPKIEVIDVQNSNLGYEKYANKTHTITAKIKITDEKLKDNYVLNDIDVIIGNVKNQCKKEIKNISYSETEINFDLVISSIEENGELQLEFKDNYIIDVAGNSTYTQIKDLKVIIDNIAPQGAYRQELLESGKIKAIIQTNENIRSIDGWTTADSNIFTKTFPANVSYKIKIHDYAQNISEVEINVTGASYIILKYAAHNSEIGWTYGLGNYDIAGKEAVKRKTKYRIEALAFRVTGKVDSDFVKIRGFVNSYWNTTSNYGKCRNTGFKYKLRGAPNSNSTAYYTMNSQELSTISGEKYIQIGGAGINAVGNVDYYGNNPIPFDSIYGSNNEELYPYGVSEIQILLKNYDELSVAYQILIDGKGWLKTCVNGELASEGRNLPMTAIRAAIIPNSEVENLVELWNKDIGTYIVD